MSRENSNQAKTNPKILENSVKQLKRKLENFQDQDCFKTQPKTQIGNLNSNRLKIQKFKIQFKNSQNLYHKIDNKICEFLRPRSRENSIENLFK